MTPRTVLIVDDDTRNRKLTRDVLTLAGFHTLEAESGEDAVDLARIRQPDVILMDLRLPDLDGAEALLRLKRDPATDDIPVVALTAVVGARDALLRAGFAAYVEKPFDVRTFPAEVGRYCRPRPGSPLSGTASGSPNAPPRSCHDRHDHRR